MKHLTTDQLISFHLNELSNKESKLLKQHIEGCLACQNEFLLISELHEDWMNPTNVDLSGEVLNEIMIKIEDIQLDKDEKQFVKRRNSKKVRLIHLALAAAATFLFFQFQFTEHILNSNQQVVQTIEQTSNLMEKNDKIKITFPKFWEVIKN